METSVGKILLLQMYSLVWCQHCQKEGEHARANMLSPENIPSLNSPFFLLCSLLVQKFHCCHRYPECKWLCQKCCPQPVQEQMCRTCMCSLPVVCFQYFSNNWKSPVQEENIIVRKLLELVGLAVLGPQRQGYNPVFCLLWNKRVLCAVVVFQYVGSFVFSRILVFLKICLTE